jgi:hypothetical protein
MTVLAATMAFVVGAGHGFDYVLSHMGFANFFTHGENRAFVGEARGRTIDQSCVFRPGDNPF